MTKAVQHKTRRKRRLRIPALTLMSLLMIAGGGLRSADLISEALATTVSAPPPSASSSQPADLLDAIKAREAAVAQREEAILAKEAALQASLSAAEAQLDALAEAEARLTKLVGHIDNAAQKDIDQLTAVYAAMKPKDAAALFSEMAPEFASGFLASMPTDRAAAILSEVDPKLAYSFSVLLAGRNAHLRSAAD